MKKRLRLILICCAVLAALFITAPTASAAIIVAEGGCGADYDATTSSNLVWTLDSDGVMTISGSGEMTEYAPDPRFSFGLNADIKTLVIRPGVTSIGEYSFVGCNNLTSVTIPASVASIGWRAFSNCPALSEIKVDARNANYSSKDGVLFSRDKTELFKYPAGNSRTDYSIPSGVTVISHYAFYDCSGLTSVVIPDSVTEIGHYAFYGCTGLKRLTIPDSVTGIGEWVFHNCTGLESVDIPAGVTSISSEAFSGCTGLTSVTIQDGVTEIGSYAFQYCTGLKSVTFPASVKKINAFAFSGCNSLTSISVPAGVTDIYRSFTPCTNLLEITVDADNPAYLSTDGILFNKDKTELLCYPAAKSDASYTIPDSVADIQYNAFVGSRNLLSVTVPDSVKSIGEFAFRDSDSQSVYFEGDAPTVMETGSYVLFEPYASFDATDTLYYISGRSGWTDSPGYDAEAKTWYGYALRTWTPSSPFIDVYASDYYYKPVLWAVARGITNGTSAALFSPLESCTRGQVVTFLWRAMGSPEPKSLSSPFADVQAPGEYYYKAVLWAAENGITTGVTETAFKPNNTVTRGQFVTFLWRAVGTPVSSAANPFTDVKSGEYYTEAVVWAAATGVTTGTSITKFSPADDCARGQVVTFLYRHFGE